jgi:hypothetical protein
MTKKEAISRIFLNIYRYPLTVSDILICDNQSLLEWFIPEGKIY